MAEAEAAFVGTVTAVDWRGRRATVTVEDVWRGDVDNPAVVVGGLSKANSMSSVDRYYRVGERYLFLPYAREAGSWQDNICSSTQEYTPTLDALRPTGATPTPTPPASAADSSGRETWLTVVALALVAGATGTWLRLWRRRVGTQTTPDQESSSPI